MTSPQDIIKNEVIATFNTPEVWVDPDPQLIAKLLTLNLHRDTKQLNEFITRLNRNEIDLSKRTQLGDLELIEKLRRLYAALSKTHSTSRKIEILEDHRGSLSPHQLLILEPHFSKLYYDLFVGILEKKIALAIETYKIELGIKPSSFTQNPDIPSAEQIKSYESVKAIFDKQPYWKGSLTDFVFIMDTLKKYGYVASFDADAHLAAQFYHQPVGKKPKKLEASTIKARRRNMGNDSRYKPSKNAANFINNLPPSTSKKNKPN